MDLNYFKKKLEEEKTSIEERLSRIAERNPQNPDDWETKMEDLNIDSADKSEMADTMEELGNTQALETTMEGRLNEVNEAIKKIEDGSYGTCKVKGCKIEEDRLRADPTADTCIAHVDHIE